MFDVLARNEQLSKERSYKYSSDVVAAMSVIEAFILWDEIYYVDDICKTHGFAAKYGMLLDKLNAAGTRFISIPEERFKEVRNKVEARVGTNADIKGNYVLYYRTLEYYELSKMLSINYLPSIQRAKFLRSRCKESINRMHVMNALENELSKYYEEINRKLSANVIQFDMPLLCDYALRDGNENTDMLTMALKLKDDAAFLLFRDWTEKIEKNAEHGNLRVVNSMLNEIHEISQSCIRKKTSGWGLSISFHGILLPEVSLSRELHFGRKFGMHISFLRSIIDYGVGQRR